MSLVCPKCGAGLSVFKVRDEFECSECRTLLAARTFRAMLFVFILWTIIDLPVMLLSYGLFEGDRAVTLHIVISGVVGIAMFVTGMNAWAVVTIRETHHAS
jgi:hypothetical protein